MRKVVDPYGIFRILKTLLKQRSEMKNRIFVLAAILLGITFSGSAIAAPGGDVKAKFYDFSDQLIDGEVKRPTALYTDVRQEVKFQRLLRLKRSFIEDVLRRTARDRVFK